MAVAANSEEWDREHTRMLEMLTSLRDVRRWAAKDDAVLDALVDLYDTHTRREEEVLAQLNPSELSAHTAEHARIRRSLLALAARRRCGHAVEEAIDEIIGLFLTVLFPSDAEAFPRLPA